MILPDGFVKPQLVESPASGLSLLLPANLRKNRAVAI